MARRIVLLVLIVGLAIAARNSSSASDGPDNSFKEELKALEGNWRCTRVELAGRLLPEALVKGDRYVIEEDKLQTYWSDTNKGGGATILKIDSTANSKTIDIEYTSGSNRGKTQLGIYRLDGNKLEVAWGELGATKRPAKFTSRPGVGSAQEYRVFEREKD
jgi:uncharacterized protein (TIGR03067 family)